MIRQGMGMIAALLLTACAQVQTVNTTSAQPGNSETCDGVMEFYTAVSLLSSEAQGTLQQALRANQLLDENPCNQLRLAILLSKPDTNFRDDSAVDTLLKDFLNTAGYTHAPSRSFASLLIDMVNERQWLQANIDHLTQAISQEETVSQTLARKLKQQHIATKALQSQLDQLQSIERDINEKEQSAATTAADKNADEADQDTPD